MPEQHPIIGITTYEKRVGLIDIDMVGIATDHKMRYYAPVASPFCCRWDCYQRRIRTMMQQNRRPRFARRRRH